MPGCPKKMNPRNNNIPMKIEVYVKPNAREEKLEKIEDNQYKAWVKEEPKENKANLAVIKLLSRHFKVPPSLIALSGGAKSKKKTFVKSIGFEPESDLERKE